MVLDQAVPHPANAGVTLLRAGVTLDERVLARLPEMGVRELWIRCPRLRDLAKFTDPRIVAANGKLLVMASGALDPQSGDHVRIDYNAYRKAVVGVIDLLAARPRAAILLGEIAAGSSLPLRHAGTVCFLSLLMGLKLDFYLIRERAARLGALAARDLSSLGLGALLHDIGVQRLVPDVIERWNQTHDESDPQWREHVKLGFEAVKNELDPSAVAVVLHHHQHFDGSGFPPRTELSGLERPLEGNDIHVFARIAAAADLYARLRHPAHAPGATEKSLPSVPAVRALAQMLRPAYRGRIDPVVLRALLMVAPPYPPGTLVTLNDTTRAVVVALNQAEPCRPCVEIIRAVDANLSFDDARGERINLAKDRTLAITHVDGVSVAADNFEPTRPDEFNLDAFVPASRRAG